MALLGFLFYLLERRHIIVSEGRFRLIFWCINSGIVLTLFLSALWINPPILINLLGAIGALLQLLGFALLLKFIYRESHGSFGISFSLIAVLLFSKMGLQLLSAHPYIAQLAATILDFTIGYLHLVFLGVVTIPIFLLCAHLGYLKLTRIGFCLVPDRICNH